MAWPGFGAKDNPYTSLLYGALRARGVEVVDFHPREVDAVRPDVVHVHWPEEVFWGQTTGMAARRLVRHLQGLKRARDRGAGVVWTVHNLRPHEMRGAVRMVWPAYSRAVCALTDCFIAMSAETREAIRGALPGLRRKPGFVVRHGHYRDAYPTVPDKAAARAALGLPAAGRVVAFVGQVRSYKNVPALIAAFRAIGADDARLLIAGLPNPPELAAEISAAAGGDRRIATWLRRLDDGEIAAVVAASDLVALPFRDILHSGSVLLALSLDRPVLVPGHGSLIELRELVGPAWVRLYDGDLDPGVLSEAMAWAADASARPGRAPLDELGWDRIADQTLAVYERARAAGR